MRSNLLASASSLAGILESVTRFYCGQAKTLTAIGKTEWQVADAASGKIAEGVRVVRKAGRYRFEMTD